MDTYRVNIMNPAINKRTVGFGYLCNDIWRVKTIYGVFEVLNIPEEITVFEKVKLQNHE